MMGYTAWVAFVQMPPPTGPGDHEKWCVLGIGGILSFVVWYSLARQNQHNEKKEDQRAGERAEDKAAMEELRALLKESDENGQRSIGQLMQALGKQLAADQRAQSLMRDVASTHNAIVGIPRDSPFQFTAQTRVGIDAEDSEVNLNNTPVSNQNVGVRLKRSKLNTKDGSVE